MKVKVISGTSVVSFNRELNDHLKEGWQLKGEMIVNLAPYNGRAMAELFYSQMLIKYNFLPETEVKKSYNKYVASPDRPQPTIMFDSQIN